jgi:hypothetical protein
VNKPKKSQLEISNPGQLVKNAPIDMNQTVKQAPNAPLQDKKHSFGDFLVQQWSLARLGSMMVLRRSTAPGHNHDTMRLNYNDAHYLKFNLLVCFLGSFTWREGMATGFEKEKRPAELMCRTFVKNQNPHAAAAENLK